MATCNTLSILGRACGPCLLGLSLAALLVSAASQVQAGPLATTPLAFNDGNGPDGGIWRGSFTATGGPTIGNEFTATIDYAVFPPGRFQQYLTDNGFLGSDPSGVGDAVYAYQVSSVTSATPGIGQLSVGLDTGDLLSSIGSVVGNAGEVTPTTSANQITSAFWSFSGSPLTGGDVSEILVITSPSEPELDTLQLTSGVASPNATYLVPSLTDSIGTFREIPEPATASLLAVLATGLLPSRRRSH